MHSRPFRIAATALVLGVASFSLVACTKDSPADTAVADTAVAESAASPAELPTTAEPATAAEPATTVESVAVEAPTPTAATTDTAPTTTSAGTAASPAASALAPNAKIFYVAVGAGSFLTLAKLLANADLITTINGDGPFTVFAPTDTAFAGVPAETLNALLADKAKLTKVLLYHVVPGRLKAADLKPGDTATAEGATLKVSVDATGKMMVNDATVAAADVVASNGVIHVIDKVLIPPDL